jgi:hypothetical protein
MKESAVQVASLDRRGFMPVSRNTLTMIIG